MLVSVTPLVRSLLVLPSAPTRANALNACGPDFAAFTMSVALMPSTSSAFRPVATPVAFVVNGLASRAVLPCGGAPPVTPARQLFSEGEGKITPPSRLLPEVKRKLPPPPVFFDSRQYSFAALERQP